MFDDLEAYYHESVVDSYISYRDVAENNTAGRSRDLREALNAATALFHFREHFTGTDKLSRSAVELLCSDFGLLGDVVNSAKHRTLTANTPHGAPLVSNAASISEVILIIEYSDEDGTYNHAVKTINVTVKDGVNRDLMDVLTNVLNFWEQRMVSLGFLSEVRTFKYKPPIREITRKENVENKLDFTLVIGHRFTQAIRMLRFNSETGEAEVMPELEGATMKFSIRVPKHDLEITLKHKESGQGYSTTVELSDSESQVIAGMNDGNEKQSYLNSLQCVKDGYRKLADQAELQEQIPIVLTPTTDTDVMGRVLPVEPIAPSPTPTNTKTP